MKKQFRVLSLLLIAIIQGCSLQDHVVPGPGILPDAIKKIIDERYPGHSELDPSALEKDKVFLIRFRQQGSIYALISNKNEILEAQRAVGNPRDSLTARINGTAMQGGTFTNYRIADELFQSSRPSLRSI